MVTEEKVIKTKKLNSVQELARAIEYANPSNRPVLYIVFALIISICGYSLLSDTYSIYGEFNKKLSSDNFGIILEFFTLAVILGIWVSDLKKEWRLSLKKYLTVEFKYKNKVQAVCEFAPLIGESDTRAMAQSIGQSMNGGDRLPIMPMLSDIKKEIVCDVSNQAPYLVNEGLPLMHYAVTVRLTEKIIIKGGQNVHWVPPFSASKEDPEDGN